ncbi:MAG TPA: DnaJ domain-containing protein [Kofleriaceae bacterium]|nr:DnaJ domain-containing protein [Kofleriaceae bacterium]
MAEAPINIKLRCASWQQLSSIYKRDLSRQAIFLKSGSPPPIGTPVRIDLTLPTESMIVLTGAVSEHIPPGGLGGRGPGVDIRLTTIPQSALWLIETALASAQKQAAAAASSAASAAVSTARETSDAAVTPGIDDGKDLASAEDDLRKALGQELASLRRLNPFQVLGVGYEASDDDVRSAFGELTRRYHPDRFTRYTSQDLRGLAAEIFILIRDAYRKLVDEASRQKTLATVGARPSVKVPTLKPAQPRAMTPTPERDARTPPPAVERTPPPAIERTPPPVVVPPRPDRTPAPKLERTPAPAPERNLPLPPPETLRRPMKVEPPTVGENPATDYAAAEALLDEGRHDEALTLFKIYARKNPNDRAARAGIELAEGMRAIAQRDRLEAAQRFEAVLEIDPANERAARELAEMRRLATNERKGLLSRLMGKKE